MYSMRTCTRLIVTLLLSGCSFGVAHAQEVSVSPFILDYKAEARTIEHATLTLTNASGGRVDVYPTVNNISVGENGGIDEFISPSMSDRTSSLSSWLEISRRTIELEAGQTTTIDLTLKVNPTPTPGTYHALVSFPTGSNRDEAEAKVRAGSAKGVIVNVTIEDTSNELMSLSRFSIERFITSPENSGASYLVENTGDTDMKPSGDIIIYNRRGEEVASIPVNPENVTVRPGESRTFTAPVPVEGLIGKYKAYLTLQYGNTQRAQLQDADFFYAVPWKKLIALFGGLLLVALALSLLIHRRFATAYADDDDTDYIPLHVRDGKSDALHHDIDMKPRL
jgi:hypothetical protein